MGDVKLELVGSGSVAFVPADDEDEIRHGHGCCRLSSIFQRSDCFPLVALKRETLTQSKDRGFVVSQLPPSDDVEVAAHDCTREGVSGRGHGLEVFDVVVEDAVAVEGGGHVGEVAADASHDETVLFVDSDCVCVGTGLLVNW